MPLYLGFDSSTQSLSAIVIDVDGGVRRVVFEDSLAFDQQFPEFGTHHGVLPSTDPSVAVSSPVLWAAALDAMMARVAAAVDVSRIAAISGSAQQHGSVYLNASATAAAGRARPRASPGAASRADAVAPRLADLDGLEHRGGVPRDCRGGRRGRHPGPAHRLARVRALHRAADPQVRDPRAGGLRPDGSDPSRELVPRVAARRTPRADRSRRRIGDEPDGSRVVDVVGCRHQRDGAGPEGQAAGARAGLLGGRAAGVVLAGEARLPGGAGGRMVRGQSRAA